MRISQQFAVLMALVLGAALMVSPVAGQDLTDPQVAHVAVTANAIDVDLAKVALQRGSSSSVKAFAQTMVDDHTGVNKQAGELATKLGVTPEPNDVSKSLQQGADEAKAKLTRLSGSEFDAAYIEREVGYHQAVLDAIDGLLIPTTENAELKQLLQTVRPAIVAHLERARGIQRELAQQ